MKKLFNILLMLAIICAFSVRVFAQPDEQLTREQAAARILDYQAKVNELDAKYKAVDADVNGLKLSLEQTKKATVDCNESLYKLVGATNADVDKFRQRIGQLEGKVRAMRSLSDDVLADKQDEVKLLEEELNTIRGEKMCCLPEFFNKVISLAKDINPGLIREKKIKTYTVGNWADTKDCMWNIAGKMEIFGDPFQWPKIWQANTTIVRNPDIIHPGQVLTLPQKGPKTDDDAKAERKYWRQKRAAQEKPEADKAKEAAPKK